MTLSTKDIQTLQTLQTEMNKVAGVLKYWVIKDYQQVVVPELYAETFRVYDGEDLITFQEFIETLQAFSENDDILAKHDLEDPGYYTIEAIIDTLTDTHGREDYLLLGVKEERYTADNTLFLSLEDAETHLKENPQYYSPKAHPYAMQVWRSPKVEALLRVLREADLTKLLPIEEA